MATYFEMVKKDIENAILDGYYDVVILNNKQDKVKLYVKLLTQMWNDEHITGNSCGGYYFEPFNAITMVQENIEEVRDAYSFFNYDLTEDLNKRNYIEIDSRTRCYFLTVVLYEVLKEIKMI
jgi:hypothetical protein